VAISDAGLHAPPLKISESNDQCKIKNKKSPIGEPPKRPPMGKKTVYSNGVRFSIKKNHSSVERSELTLPSQEPSLNDFEREFRILFTTEAAYSESSS
jgi:hypothetical protein